MAQAASHSPISCPGLDQDHRKPQPQLFPQRAPSLGRQLDTDTPAPLNKGWVGVGGVGWRGHWEGIWEEGALVQGL